MLSFSVRGMPRLLLSAVAQLRQAMEFLGCQSWDVGAVLTTDKEVSRLNRQVMTG